MAFIHCSSYLHRDLKSSNILLAIGWTRGNAGNDIEYLQAKVGRPPLPHPHTITESLSPLPAPSSPLSCYRLITSILSLLPPSPLPQVADFDGARKLKEGCSKLQSDTYLSILYQAPETLLCQEVGKPADVFSFGVLLWELITLIEPWEVGA
jgi:serine/threonine protein kinase